MRLFSDRSVDLIALKKKAYNYRWAETKEGVIPLTAADSDFPVSDQIKKALTDYIEDGYFSYTPKEGLPEFIDAIWNYLVCEKKETVNKSCILPVDSAARGMFIIAEAVLKPGDDAIVFNPVDFLFRHSVKHAGANVIEYPAKISEGKIDLSNLESYITPKTKMIGLCNPHNPLGLLYEKEQLRTILEFAEKYDLYIMNDEIWSDIVFPEKQFVSILSIDEAKTDRVLSVYGFSKAFGIAGLRVGCIYTTNQDIFKKIFDASCVMSTAGGISSLSQVAGIACLNDSLGWLKLFLEHLTEMRNYVCDRVNKMPLITCRAPEATFLAYADIRCFGMKSEEFTDYMKDRVKLALIPGGETFFGSMSEGYVRICFSTSYEILKEGMDRLETGIGMLIKERGLTEGNNEKT